MKRIGIRELRQEASKHLRDVERGATIEITDRGRPVARIVPLAPAAPMGVLDTLRAQGRLRPAKGDLRDVLALPLLKPKPGVPLPSEELARLRDMER